jgi:hypothetical protein
MTANAGGVAGGGSVSETGETAFISGGASSV